VVSASSVSVFKPGSTSPSAILFDAWENFNNRSPKADENIRSIKLDLAAAVDEVIDAAGQEWEPAWQRKLLSVRVPCWTFRSIFQNVERLRPPTSANHFWTYTIPMIS
jgi:hypothetical protein